MRNRLSLFTLILYIFCPLASLSQVDLNNGLMAYYPFNGNANDASGNGNNPIFNNATPTTDYYGNPNSAYYFNGVDNYIEIPNRASLNSNELTLCAMVDVQGFYYGNCYNNCIIDKGTADGEVGNYSLRFTQSAITNGNCSLQDTINQQFVGYASGNPAAGLYNPKVQKNVWTCVVYTVSKDSLKLYVGGNLVWKTMKSLDIGSNSYNVFLGRKGDDNFPYWFNGVMDEVRIYSRALSADEVKAYSQPCTQEISVTASFTAPDTVCVNTPVTVKNTSVGATNYYWSFCSSINTTPDAVNIGNPGNTLSMPVFCDYGLDKNGNYYALVTNHISASITRLNFGNSLLNTPTAEDLGNFGGVLPVQLEGIQVLKVNGNWYGIAVGGGYEFSNAEPRIVKLDFGNSLSNMPVATNWGNIGDLNLPIDFYIAEQNGNYYGFTMNVYSNTITRFDFGPDFTNPPTGVNLGNIGNLNYPDGFTFINSNGNWYAFAVNTFSNNITRLNFGSSLTNIPVPDVITNPGNLLSKPRDISVLNTCNGIFGYVLNAEGNNMIKLDFGSDLNSNPSAIDLGNIGNFSVPHSFSDLFTADNDIYAFISNATGPSISRIKFEGCSNMPASTLENPSEVVYQQPGVYTIDLMADIGLPTQTSFCKQIVVNDCSNPCDSFKVNAGNDTSICYGDSIQLNATGALNYVWNSSAALSDTTINNPVAYPEDTQVFIVKGSNDLGCFATDTIKVTVLPLPVFTITNDTAVCTGGSIQLEAKGTGNNTYHWTPSAGLSDAYIYNPVAKPAVATQYYVTATNASGCISADSVIVDVLNLPKVTVINDTSICNGQTVTLHTNVSDADIFKWTPSNELNDSSVQNPIALPSTSVLYVVTAGNGICSAKDSVLITVLPLPDITVSNDTTLCGNASVSLNAYGADSYTWNPTTGLSNANVSNPVASSSVTTTYYVTGTGTNSCSKTDSVTITKLANPVFSLMPQDASVCAGDSVLLTASGGDIYSWAPITTVVDPSVAATPVFPSVNTTYQVIITNSVCKVNDTLTADVEVKEAPVIAISKSNDIDCINYESQLIAAGGSNYLWSPATYISSTRIYNPMVSPRTDTWYAVEVKGNNGCSSKDSILVKSNYNPEEAKFEVATAFTPNHDGLNDCFSVRYWGPADVFDMSIYNRWGQLVFHSNSINACWDGKFKGLEQTPGTYVYKISVSSTCTDGLVHKKGTFVLIR